MQNYKEMLRTDVRKLQAKWTEFSFSDDAKYTNNNDKVKSFFWKKTFLELFKAKENIFLFISCQKSCLEILKVFFVLDWFVLDGHNFLAACGLFP